MRRAAILSILFYLIFILFAYAAEVKVVAGAKAFKDPVTGMEFVYVKGGCFKMGDTFGYGYWNEKHGDKECVGDFYLGVYEVTQAQWEKVMGTNPSFFKKGGNYPVEQVSWDAIQGFLERLNRQAGRKYRLPTEAEWEYAAKSGGKEEKYAGTNSELGEYAWYSEDSKESTHPVGQKKPNGLGLYDMSGNVWEWCADLYYSYGEEADDGAVRVIRGGSWESIPRYLRAATRGGGGPTYRGYNVGFRLAVSAR